MHVLLTDGAGFIGRHVWAELRDRGHRVRVLDSLREEAHRVLERVVMKREPVDVLEEAQVHVEPDTGAHPSGNAPTGTVPEVGDAPAGLRRANLTWTRSIDGQSNTELRYARSG